jgi:hypothetical protein
MKKIELTKGYVALVSDVDYEWAMQWKWYAQETDGRVYATRKDYNGGEQKTSYMHREILARKLERQLRKGELVDHREGIGLDNRRGNLRPATGTQNQSNRSGPNKNNTSGFLGVTWNKQARKWQARIVLAGKHKFLGLYSDPAEAARVRDEAALELHGEFAKTNF